MREPTKIDLDRDLEDDLLRWEFACEATMKLLGPGLFGPAHEKRRPRDGADESKDE